LAPSGQYLPTLQFCLLKTLAYNNDL
jgi:hypothetical protein